MTPWRPGWWGEGGIQCPLSAFLTPTTTLFCRYTMKIKSFGFTISHFPPSGKKCKFTFKMFKVSFLATISIPCSLVCSKYAKISGACCTTLLWLSYLMMFIHPWNTTCSNIFLFETNHGYSTVFSQALKFSLIFCVSFSLFLLNKIPLCPISQLLFLFQLFPLLLCLYVCQNLVYTLWQHFWDIQYKHIF